MPEAYSHITTATRTSPEVVCAFNGTELLLSLSGESSMEDAVEWYSALFAWLDDVLRLPEHIPFRFTLAIDYANTSSQKVLLDLADMLRKHYLTSNRSVYTVYRVQDDDDDLAEMAQELFEEWDEANYTIERYE